MTTIINKKGNVGYTAEYWNCSAEHFDPKRRDGEYTTIQIIIRFTEVKSCGKKQMTLSAPDGSWSDMRGKFYHPEKPIYETYEDAVEAAKEMYAEMIPEILRRQAFRLNGLNARIDEDKWASKHIEECIAYTTKIEAGDYPLEIIDYAEWLETLRNKSKF